jgi:hypothetical protein
VLHTNNLTGTHLEISDTRKTFQLSAGEPAITCMVEMPEHSFKCSQVWSQALSFTRQLRQSKGFLAWISAQSKCSLGLRVWHIWADRHSLSYSPPSVQEQWRPVNRVPRANTGHIVIMEPGSADLCHASTHDNGFLDYRWHPNMWREAVPIFNHCMHILILSLFVLLEALCTTVEFLSYFIWEAIKETLLWWVHITLF